MHERNMTRHKEGIDGIRALACLGIVLMHVFVLGGYSFAGGGERLERVINSFAGLTIVFFVLSGFGISAGYLSRFQSGKIDLEGFYFRRYKKIWPFFFVVTFIGVVFEHNVSGVEEGIMELSLLYGFLPNNGNVFAVNGVCWTLGTIFAFYVLYPFISVLLTKRRRAWGALVVSIVLMFTMEYYFLTDKFVITPFLNRSNILYSLPFFLSGCILSIYQNEVVSLVKGREKICDIICVLATVILLLSKDQVYGIHLVDYKYWLLGVIWIAYALGTDRKWLTNIVMKTISRYSMEIYLSHMIFRKAIGYLHISSRLGNNAVSFSLEYILVLCSALCFAKVIDNLNRMIAKRKMTWSFL